MLDGAVRDAEDGGDRSIEILVEPEHLPVLR
jgi:hypothetical protein